MSADGSAGLSGVSGSAPLGLGLVGAGGFAEMVARALATLDTVRLRSVTDVDERRASRLAAAHDAHVMPDVAGLLADSSVDVVVVSTPPSTHHELTLAALAAGKHVFCEKPLATSVADAREVVAASEESGRVVVVDHALRHNPLLAAVHRLQEQVLGQPRRLLYENDASDENLPLDHWFWDPDVSGGILVEHAVHAFDAANWLLGSMPSHVQTTTARRAGASGFEDGVIDLVSTTALHPGGVIATHTHSFTHASRCERQLLRLDHGSAQTTVRGWIPVEAQVDLWTDDDGVARVEQLLTDPAALFALDGAPPGPAPEGATAHASVERGAGEDAARGRGVELRLPHHVVIELTLGGEPAKEQVYAASVRAAMADLVRCVETGETPRSGVVAAAAAVTVAVGATRAGVTGQTVSLLVPPPPVEAPVPTPGETPSSQSAKERS
ncbi:MAG: oxidoreductase domain protein [Humibacillus sp.]|nr:oxidoreductase domain protein [Humibacillus sp.]